jgi:hypothetical protein
VPLSGRLLDRWATRYPERMSLRAPHGLPAPPHDDKECLRRTLRRNVLFC